MKIKFLLLIPFLLSSCGYFKYQEVESVKKAELQSPDKVIQYSTYAGLIERLFDGFVTIDTVLCQGNHGIGTTDCLHGELIIMDGIPYRVTYDGVVEIVGKEETTPYVTLANVDPDQAVLITLPAGTTVQELTAKVAELAADQFQKNFPYAIRLEGKFASARMRSIPKLEKPFISLADVAKNQSIFTFENESLSIIGFWNPSYAEDLNPPQWHIHGLNAARTSGGHVLDFTTAEDVQVSLWKLIGFDVNLPDSTEFAEADFSQDLSAQIQKVNRDKED
ncbi:MAG: acetolactate decarboxylase [Verrucomicrobiota bacterium]